MKIAKADRGRIILAASSGLMLTAAFPNLQLSWLAWFGLVPLLAAIRDCGVKKSFKLGFSAGLIHYLTLIYWLAYTMRTYGYLPWPVCIAVLIFFSAILALFSGVFTAIVAYLRLKPDRALIMIPVVWVSVEYLRSFIFTGFPWEFIGHSQYSTLQIIQISDILGVYGISYLIVFVNTVIFFLILGLTKHDWQGVTITRRFAAVSITAAIFLSGFVWSYGQWRLNAIDRLAKAAPQVRSVIVQGNIEQSVKWNPAFQLATAEKYLRLSRSAGNQNPDLFIWPETALPFYYNHNAALTAKVRKGIRDMGTYFLFGSPSFARKPGRIDYYNSAYLVDPEGKPLGKYDKAHLVPFGEYVPFKRWLPFLGKIVAQVGDFSRGKIGATIPWKNYKLGVLICYEGIFPYLARAMVKNGASLLIIITNDAWYGRSSAPYQHLSLAVFRAVENRRALIRSANTGISVFIDPAGRILAATPLFQEAAVFDHVPVLTEQTFYTRFGDVFAIFCMAVVVGAILWKGSQEIRLRKNIRR